jgi:Tol biopolymer transport system component/serine/threonine protein kinase
MNPERYTQIDRVFQQALSQPPGRLDSFLKEACAGDAGLRREVESLLEYDQKARSFMNSPAPGVTGENHASDPYQDYVGRSLLHYRIVEKIGEGGMGVVYRAHDAHLDRSVALKVLPPEAMTDPERKRRFIQEAKAASALNHSNIITIHDISQAEGIDFIAMEYVAGKTLAQLIEDKGLPLQEALNCAIQIVDALAAAHESAIVHRDLKPGNIMVTGKGQVKVLDFGLAKLAHPSHGNVLGLSKSSETLTKSSTVVGTVAYMSPEQAEGKAVDARSDIFSFGAVLYEMVTGRQAFKGDSNISTLAAVLHEDPKPISGIAGDVSQELERIIVRCLKKDPSKRFQRMDDVKAALVELREASASGGLETAGVGRPKPKRRFIWVLGAAAALLAVIVIPLGWYLFRQRADVLREPLRIVPFTALPGTEARPRFSPDGKFVAFQWNGPAKDNLDIYVKRISGGEPLRLTTDPAADSQPAWSPDGSQIAFMRWSGEVDSLYTMQSLGGGERKLHESTEALIGVGLSWSPDGRWLAFSERDAFGSPLRICLLSVDTRQKTPLTSPPPGPFGDIYPEFSPDGKRIAFFRVMSFAAGDIWVQPVPSGEPIRLTHENYDTLSRPAWTTDGHEILFTARYALFRVPAAGGVPQAVAGVGENAGDLTVWRNHIVFMQLSQQREVIYRIPGPTNKGKDRSATPILTSTRREGNPDYSPDGKKIAFQSTRSGSYEIYTSNSDGANPVQLTNLRKFSANPRWSPDSKRIAFSCRLEEDEDIYVIDADGGALRRLTNERSYDTLPTWSRDGKWIYFASDRSGTFQVWKMPSEGGKAVQVTKGGGHYAVESFDGKMLYYLKPQQNVGVGPIWKVPCEGGEETPVIDRRINSDWALRPEGIYFAAGTGKKYSIEFLSFKTGKITPFYLEETPNGREFLTISPDGKWLLYDDMPPRESDLMLVENFR